MTLIDFVRLTRRNLGRLILATIVGALLAYGYAMTLPKRYAADASGFVIAANASQTTNEAIVGSSLAGSKADNYTYLVQSRAVAAAVIDKLGLETTPQDVASRVSGEVVQTGSVILKVTAVAGTAKEAQQIADATVEATAAEANRLELGGGPVKPDQKAAVRIIPVESALLPSAPFAPNMQKYALVGAVLGLGLMYLLIFSRRLLDTRMRSVKDVEALASTSALGIIPLSPELNVKVGRGRIGKLGVASEGFRQLRTNLRFVSVDKPPRSIVVTSANPGEGKSTVAATLARVLGEAGQKTVIIDADLRKPTLMDVFERDGLVGLSQILSGQVTLEEALQDTDQGNLRLITAGRIPPNPSELLGSQRMHALVDELKKDHLVIMDAPPLLPVTDAGLLSGFSDGTILVVAVGKTHKEQVTFAAKILGQVGGTLLGAVLNMAPKRGLGAVAYGNGYGYSRYGYGSYGYGYGSYGYGYGADSGRKGGRLGRKGRRAKGRSSNSQAAAPVEVSPVTREDNFSGRSQ